VTRKEREGKEESQFSFGNKQLDNHQLEEDNYYFTVILTIA
jgi:hypothetical protein